MHDKRGFANVRGHLVACVLLLGCSPCARATRNGTVCANGTYFAMDQGTALDEGGVVEPLLVLGGELLLGDGGEEGVDDIESVDDVDIGGLNDPGEAYADVNTAGAGAFVEGATNGTVNASTVVRRESWGEVAEWPFRVCVNESWLCTALFVITVSRSGYYDLVATIPGLVRADGALVSPWGPQRWTLVVETGDGGDPAVETVVVSDAGAIEMFSHRWLAEDSAVVVVPARIDPEGLALLLDDDDDNNGNITRDFRDDAHPGPYVIDAVYLRAVVGGRAANETTQLCERHVDCAALGHGVRREGTATKPRVCSGCGVNETEVAGAGPIVAATRTYGIEEVWFMSEAYALVNGSYVCTPETGGAGSGGHGGCFAVQFAYWKEAVLRGSGGGMLLAHSVSVVEGQTIVLMTRDSNATVLFESTSVHMHAGVEETEGAVCGEGVKWGATEEGAAPDADTTMQKGTAEDATTASGEVTTTQGSTAGDATTASGEVTTTQGSTAEDATTASGEETATQGGTTTEEATRDAPTTTRAGTTTRARTTRRRSGLVGSSNADGRPRGNGDGETHRAASRGGGSGGVPVSVIAGAGASGGVLVIGVAVVVYMWQRGRRAPPERAQTRSATGRSRMGARSQRTRSLRKSSRSTRLPHKSPRRSRSQYKRARRGHTQYKRVGDHVYVHIPTDRT